MTESSKGSNSLPCLAEFIRAAHQDCRSHAEKAAEAAIEAGRLLIEAKELVQHGEWEDWLAENVHFAERTARRYMQLFRSGLKPATVAVLGLRGAAELLADKAQYDSNNECVRRGVEKLKAARDARPKDWNAEMSAALDGIEAAIFRLEALDYFSLKTREFSEELTEALIAMLRAMQAFCFAIDPFKTKRICRDGPFCVCDGKGLVWDSDLKPSAPQ